MKRLIFLSLLLLTLMLNGCKSRKYINEIPYKFKFNTDRIENYLSIEKQTNADSSLYEYPEELTDREVYLKEKYSILLQVKPNEILNYPFYDFIDQKIGYPYVSGNDKDGITMASFVQDLFIYTYNIELPNQSLDIFNSDKIKLFLGRDYLEEGDLIFFRYSKDNPVSDVAIYLRNNKIVTTTQKGKLGVYNFSDDYFQKRYLVSGRLKAITNDSRNGK